MSWYNFFYRNGYGFYVWGSYGIALIAMGGEVILLRRRHRALEKQARSK
jgi:heme exporter protein CcmD